MISMTFSAIVVVYNISCEDSLTCQALRQLNRSDVSVIICDNSTSDYGNRAYCESQKWVYLGGNGNVGISKAYNSCIDYLMDGHQTEFLCLFDDDTHVDVSYFDALKQAAETTAKNIFVPLIYAGGGLISPCILNTRHKVKMFSCANEAVSYTGTELTAINSCMAIRTSLFRDFRYDEKIFLDGVDHNFILTMRQRGESLQIFDYSCEHAFSGVEKPPMNGALKRFCIYAKDYKYILRSNLVAYLCLVGKRALSLSIQYKTARFFLAWIKCCLVE